MKKTALRLIPVVVILLGLIISPIAHGAEGEVRIGFLSAFTGVFSSFGTMQKEGAVLALEEVDYKVAGKDIVIIYADDQLDNDLAVLRSAQLVEQDNVDVITGLVSGDEGLTVGDFMRGKNIPVVSMYAASEDMTMREFYPYIVRPTWTGAQPMDVFGYWVAKELGYKKIYMIGEDYSYPYNQIGGFKRGFFRGGGEEVTTVWHPVPQGDFSSLIATIPLNQGYDAVLYNGAGSDAIAFVKQFVEFGMHDQIALLGQSNTFERPDLEQMPKELAGSYSAHLVGDNLNSPEWIAFRDAFVERWGHLPSAASEFAYVTMKMILRAVDLLAGDVSDKLAFVEAMREVDMSDAPRSPLYLDDYNAVVQNVYIRQVALDENGELYNKVLYTVEEVSQFGPYDPELYMSYPEDVGNYPPQTRAQMPAEMLQVEQDYVFIPFGQ
jgi:branched-chain amino acid transport system substrate-binding protein